jgi:hypothetical protein
MLAAMSAEEDTGPRSDEGPFGSGWRRWAARRAKSVLARDLRVGVRGKVSGIARPLGPLVLAPFTKRPCVFWCAEIASRVEAKARGLAGLAGRTRLEWQVDLRDASSERYLVIDEVGGHIVVDPKNAVVDVRRTRIELPGRADADLGAFLLRHGFTPARLFAKDSPFTVFEAIVEVGAPAAAWGIVTEVADQMSLGYRDANIIVRRIASTRIDRAVVLGG